MTEQNQNKGDCLIQFKLPEKLKLAMDAAMADMFITSRSAFMRGLVIKAVQDYMTGTKEEVERDDEALHD